MGALFLAQGLCSLLPVLTRQREGKHSSVSSGKDANPLLPTLVTSSNPNPLPRPCLLIPSHWALRVLYTNAGGYRRMRVGTDVPLVHDTSSQPPLLPTVPAPH